MDTVWHDEFSLKGTFFNADMCGFTRLTKKYGTVNFLGLIMMMRSIVRPIVHAAGGEVLHFHGDNVVAHFVEAHAAVRASMKIQSDLREYNSHREADDRIILKIGLVQGVVLNTGLQTYGGTWDFCETLGRELAERRQVLMSKAVWKAADLTLFESIIESKTSAECNGQEYHIVQVMKEKGWVENSSDTVKAAWENELLEAFESDSPTALENFMSGYETDGFALVVNLHSGMNDERDRLCVFSCVMQLMENVHIKGLHRVKRNEQRAYFFTTDAYTVVVASLVLMQLCLTIDRSHRRYRVNASIGIARGWKKLTLMFGDDYFGDSVNVAAKLCDDTAKPGEIFIDEMLYRELAQSSIRLSDWIATGMIFETRVVAVSRVEIHARELIFVKMDLPAFLQSANVQIPEVQTFSPQKQTSFGRAMVDRLKLSDTDKSTDDLERIAAIDARVAKKIIERGVFMRADISGFTRLTKKHGIMHFMALIVKMRSIVHGVLHSVGGKLLRFDGDAVVVRFDTAKIALNAAMRLQRNLREYNQGRTVDHRIILKIVLIGGEVFNTGQQYFGTTWDLCESISKEIGGRQHLLMARSIRDSVDLLPFKTAIKSEQSVDFRGSPFVMVQLRKEKAWRGGSVGASPLRPSSVVDRAGSGPSTILEVDGATPALSWTDELLEHCESGSQESMDKFRKRYEVQGYAIIVRMHTTMVDRNDQLCAFSCLLQQLAHIDLGGVDLIKRDEQRAFFFCADDFAAVATALAAVHLCTELAKAYPRYEVAVSVGIARGVDGKALVFPNDFYGDCVNVASKLGEDSAVVGEILFDDAMLLHLHANEKQALNLAGAVLLPRSFDISNVHLEAHQLDYSAMHLALYFEDRGIAILTVADVAALDTPSRSHFEDQMLKRMLGPLPADAEPPSAHDDWVHEFTLSGTFLNSDMSGFTRLTKKHGILHFLAMIVKMRALVCPIVTSFEGRVLRFDGDNISAQFPTAQNGVDAALEVQKTLRSYNESTQNDNRIILKIGLAEGEVLDTGLQLFGPTWDLCEELGEELGQKRQVLMAQYVRENSDIGAYAAIIESETPAEHDGHAYTVVQVKQEREWMGTGETTAGSTWESEVLRCFESDREEITAQVRTKYEQDGVAVIVKLHSDLTDEHDRLCVFSTVMQLLENIPLAGLRLIKRDEQRAFLFCTDAFSAVAAALVLTELCLKLERDHRRYQVEASVGIARGSGKTLVFTGDFYGDSINVASKLGEDTAKPGEIFIDELLYRELAQSSLRMSEWIASGMIFEERLIEISNVEIHAQKLIFIKMDLNDFLVQLDVGIPDLCNFNPPDQNEFGKAMVERLLLSTADKAVDNPGRMQEIDARIAADLTIPGTFFNSDMSGFTRLTKKYGILHFLGMIMKMRSIVRPFVDGAGGKIIRYDGDNVIALFPTPQAGATAALRIQEVLREFNGNKRADHRILLKIGLADGAALDTGLQLFGPTWDLCEELGEELGQARQVLMSKSVRSAAALSCFETFIEHETEACHGDVEYTIVQIEQETEWVFDADHHTEDDSGNACAAFLKNIEVKRLDKAATWVQATFRGHRVRARLRKERLARAAETATTVASDSAVAPERVSGTIGSTSAATGSPSAPPADVVPPPRSQSKANTPDAENATLPTTPVDDSPATPNGMTEFNAIVAERGSNNDNNGEFAAITNSRSVPQRSDSTTSEQPARTISTANDVASTTLSTVISTSPIGTDVPSPPTAPDAVNEPHTETKRSSNGFGGGSSHNPDDILTEVGTAHRASTEASLMEHQRENGLPAISLSPPRSSVGSTASTIF
jgi:class 3 adenylate cyclase